ncbi:MAG: hypothetical protein JW953_06490 [Anaerolineae bacterium]|nr:hypothetical protein [Anaerolineae bacterium]
MQNQRSQSFILLLVLLMATAACQSNQPTPVPTPTFMVAPSPTRIRLPAGGTPTPPAKPTPINTLVIQATYTPKPPTDTPTPLPSPTDTPLPSEPATATLTPVTGGVEIDWADAEDRPNLIPGDEGFFIWTDGNRVSIRGITRGTTYTFSGQATGNGVIANINQVSQTGIELAIQGDNRIDFQWTTTGGPEGLDFTFTGATLYISLSLAGQPKPEPDLVFVGPDKRRVNGRSLQLAR